MNEQLTMAGNPAIGTATEAESFVVDGYEKQFTDKDIYLGTLESFGADRRTETLKTRALTFEELPHPTGMEQFCLEEALNPKAGDDCLNRGIKFFLRDSEGHASLVRSTAVSTMLDRLGVSGRTLWKLPISVLVEHLNIYAHYAGKESLVIYSNGKISAMMGPGYKLVPAETVMDEVARYMETQGAEFERGFISHGYTYSIWDVGERMVSLPFDLVTNSMLFQQKVIVTTSDCGESGINILPVLTRKESEHGLSFCLPLRINHRSASMEALLKNLDLLENRFEKSEEAIHRMAVIALSYPANVLLALLKWLKVPEKYGAEVYENKLIQWKGARTAWEVFNCLTEVMAAVISSSDSEREYAELHERFARALRFRFEDYDLPGQHSYKSTLIGQKGV